MTIAFLGLGRMGRILAGHLVTDGEDVVVWNRTESKADELVDAGAARASSAADAVSRAEVVVTALFGPDTVRDVVVDGDLPWQDDALWIDVTTVSPDDARELASWASSRSLRYVHSPVVGTLTPARNRALGVLVGGADRDVEQARPVVATWADADRLRTYDTAARAAAGKLIANLALAVSMQGFVEALRLGSAEGLDVGDVVAALDKTMLAPIVGLKGSLVTADDYTDTQFSAALLAKDARLMIDTSDDDLPATAAARALLDAAVDAGRGEEDFATIARDA